MPLSNVLDQQLKQPEHAIPDIELCAGRWPNLEASAQSRIKRSREITDFGNLHYLLVAMKRC